MNKTRILIGVSLIGIGITAYSLGFAEWVGEVGSGTVTIYPAAALAIIGGLTLWSEITRVTSA